MLGLLILFAAALAVIAALGAAATIYRTTHPPRLTYGVALGRRMAVSPAEIGLEFEEHDFRLPDDTTTPAWIMRGRAGDGGPTVILSHGWSDGRYALLSWAEQFAPFASRIVAYDLRGQGESPNAKCMLGTTEIDDLIAIIRQVDDGASANSQIVLFGASMGAGISIAATAKSPECIAGIIGEGGYRRGMEPIVGFFKLNRWPVWLYYHLVGWHLMFWYSSAAKFDRAGHAAKLKCPLVMLHGTHDAICPIQAAREVAAAAPGGRLIEFPHSGHLDLASTDPIRYREALTAFFSEIEPRSPQEQQHVTRIQN